ncbi:hypothetical protein BDQ17DRAFT_1362727, partial [Cyathus striatus]
LPPELYRHIVLYLSPSSSLPDLLSLCITSKILYAEAVPVMYSTVTLIITGESYGRFLRTLLTTSRDPPYSHYITTYTLVSYSSTGGDTLDMTVQALKAMKNLKNLALHDLHGQSWPNILSFRMLLDAPFQLCSLDFSSYAKPQDLISFLRLQPTIKHLYVIKEFLMGGRSYGEFDLIIGHTSRPNLRTISLVWETTSRLSTEFLNLLKQSEIDRFKLGGHYTRPSLSKFAPYLSNLHTLELAGLRSSDLGSVKLLTKLQHLILSRSERAGFTLAFPLEGHPRIAANAFSSNAMLVWVDITVFDYNMYYRYLRDGTRQRIEIDKKSTFLNN